MSVTVKEYFNNDEMRVNVFKSKYLQSSEQSIDDCFEHIAEEISNVTIETDSDYWKKEWKEDLLKGIWRPGGSIISGINNKKKKISLFNCFKSDTEFITDKGIKTFEDFNHFDEVNVLINDGTFSKGIVKNFGEKKLLKVSFNKDKIEKVVYTTDDHLWPIIDNENSLHGWVNTVNLKPDDKIRSSKKTVDLDNFELCPIGFKHGLVFGDGYYVKDLDVCKIDLYGEYKKFIKYFNNYNTVEHDGKILINNLPNNFKKFPNFENLNWQYNLSFFIGWFAVNGNITESVELYSSKIEHLEKAKSILSTLGIYSVNIKLVSDVLSFKNESLKLYKLELDKITLFNKFFIKDNHIKNWSQVEKHDYQWKVSSIEETDLYENVWCIQVPNFENFVLENGLNTHNCTSTVIEDDTLESIYKSRYECSKMAAYRQGLGVEFSKLRPKGSPVNNSSEVSEGVVNWMKSFNSIAEEVGQRGRRPAILGALKDNHPDIIEFIKSKSDLDTLKNMNISVQISDNFMNAVQNDDEWELSFNLKGEKISKKVKAKFIFDLLCEQSFKHAEPGLQFIDNMKSGSIQEALGYDIIGTNAPVIGSSLVFTNKGLFKIEDIYNLNMDVKVLVDTKHKFIDNEYTSEKNYFAPATFKKYDNQLVYKITLANNQILECNAQHKWLTDSGYKKTKELNDKDELLIPSDGIWNKNLTDKDTKSQDYKDGILIGNFVGEGSYVNKFENIDRKALKFRWFDDNNILNYIEDKYKELTGKELSCTEKEYDLWRVINHNDIIDIEFYNWFKSFGFNGNDNYHVPEKCFTNRLFAAGFINGLISSDIINADVDGFIINSENILIKLQKLLTAFGIYTSYYKLNDNGFYLFIYDHKSAKRFFNRIGIYNNIKRDILETYINKETENSFKNASIKIHKIVKTEKIEDMYCAIVPEVHGFVVDGILSSNCSEKPLPNYGVCALASLNMEEVPNIDTEEFHEFMRKKVYSLVRFMDNVVQYEIDNDYKSPLDKQLEIVKDLREIGLGVTNLHKWFYDNNVEYASDESIKMASVFFKWYQYYAFKASCELAIDRKPCQAWKTSNDNKTLKETTFLKNLFNEFKDLKELYYNTGIRNGALLSVAPSGCGLVTNNIITDKGIESFKDIFDNDNFDYKKIELDVSNEGKWFKLNNPINVKVHDDKYQEVKKVYYNGMRKTRTIIFEDGNEATFTFNHPLLVNVEGKEKWIEVKDLEEGYDIIQY